MPVSRRDRAIKQRDQLRKETPFLTWAAFREAAKEQQQVTYHGLHSGGDVREREGLHPLECLPAAGKAMCCLALQAGVALARHQIN